MNKTVVESKRTIPKMRKVISILTLVFFLAMSSTIALADVVPGALLYLDAADNPAHPDAWTNLGTAGGELSAEGNPPEVEEGTIEIAALNVSMPGSKFYTFKESGQGFGGEGDEIELPLEDWTIEFLLRRNGGALGEEHHLAGFQPSAAMEGPRAIRLNFWQAENNLGGEIGDVPGPLDIMLEEGKWNWAAIVNEDEKRMVAYQNGEQTKELPAVDFDKKTPIDMIMIGANSYGERARTFNGSIAIVRVYNKALTEEQINQNVHAWEVGAAVDPASKLTTTWGAVKISY